MAQVTTPNTLGYGRIPTTATPGKTIKRKLKIEYNNLWRERIPFQERKGI
ncbi:hypothetical protein COLO4_03154 [Corchorus olitorius]|uniref:Uncharacterized protein n=1 Tax=Corchorus olitorius TaxID=93759 RepID=A0A1R3KZF6_9ROSI|nr:hypothetical protein COLO4_03154 [Corchorus olitorius]